MMKDYYLKKAEENLPPLRHTLLTPTGSAGVLMKGDSFVIDLGNHYVGYLSFTPGYVDKFIDAPVKLALRFCESERELTDDVADDPDFSPYGDRKINSMCHAWSCTPTYFIRKFGLGKGESI